MASCDLLSVAFGLEISEPIRIFLVGSGPNYQITGIGVSRVVRIASSGFMRSGNKQAKSTINIYASLKFTGQQKYTLIKFSENQE